MDNQPSPTTPALSSQAVSSPLQLPHLPVSPMLFSMSCENATSDDRSFDAGSTNCAKVTHTISAPVLGHLASLSSHITTQGLFHGVGSDITVHAFDKEYRLHRLILMQSKFFENLIQGPWREQQTSVVLMQFDDDNITREGFEVAVGHLYGIWTVEDERVHLNRHSCNVDNDSKLNLRFSDGSQNIQSILLTKRNVLEVLAAAAYLGIDALCDQCSKFAIRTLSTNHIVEYVQFSDMNCYNPWSSRIADACHAFLCRNGFEDTRMDCLQVFERLPEEWLIRVIGSDAFWVPSEWDRYLFCRRVVHQRRKIWCSQFWYRLGDSNEVVDPSPRTLSTSTRTFDQQDGQEPGTGVRSALSGSSPTSKHPSPLPSATEETVYDRLFSGCIIYVHMSFEQLQAIMKDIDPLTGHRFTPSDIIHEALWQQTELRTTIETSSTTNPLLGNIASHWPQMSDRPYSRRRDDRDLIPVQDGTHDGDLFLPPWSTQSFKQTDLRLTVPRGVLPVCQKNELPTSSTQNSLHTNAGEPLPSQPRSRFAPFRFSVAFQDLSLLDMNVRISSKEFFYAGSLWNVYIQKINTGQSGLQLGVHLHRHSKAPLPSPKTRMTASSPFSDVPAQPSHDGSGTFRCESDFDLPGLDRNLSESAVLERSFSNYVDKREKTKTWFKIFAVPGGPDHLIRQFQSSPDDFAVLQSWGWRSTSLWESVLLQSPKCSAIEREERLQTACMGQGHAALPDHEMSPTRKGKHVAGNEEVITSQDSDARSLSDRSFPRVNFYASPWKAIKRRLSDLGEEQTAQAKTGLSIDILECECEAGPEIELGRQHHHHLSLPPALKFSIVMGHV